MKFRLHLALLLFFAIFGAGAYAQTSNAIVFTENGEKFTLILNGLRQNEKPETNVKVEGLNANFYKAKIIFENTALGEGNFNMGIDPGSETTFVIKKNNKNVYVMRPMSMVPIAEAPPSNSNSTVVTYNPDAPAVQTVTQETTTTTTTTGDPGTSGSVSIGFNMNDNGGSINMDVSGMDVEGSSVTHQTTTTTTTVTSSSSSSSSSAYPTNPPPPAPVSYLPGYNGPIGCPMPADPRDFDSMKGSIASKSFEESKLTIAKQILNSQCLLSSQVKEIMLLFTFEETRLDFAKYAYGRTYDIGNYYKVNDAFTFESSIDDLNAYINSYRK